MEIRRLPGSPCWTQQRLGTTQRHRKTRESTVSIHTQLLWGCPSPEWVKSLIYTNVNPESHDCVEPKN